MPLDRQVEAWLEEAAASGVPPMNELPVDESRAIYNKLTVDCSPPPEPVAAVDERAVPGKYGDIPVRIYRPEGNPAFPVVVYYHGGGWVLGDLDFAHSTATLIAGRAHAVVVTVDYRLAPEHPFPAPVDDAYSALRWVLDNPALLDADVERVAVAGDSAGGNLAAVVALMARNDPGPRPVHQLLLYPVTDLAHDTESARAFADGPFLT
ncbi:MAG TPA: alpha/beta hydrolase, partial [Amycolatopsis sp.]|nr:alpha/beta hydrolase [Amycolatopsis sp.]